MKTWCLIFGLLAFGRYAHAANFLIGPFYQERPASFDAQGGISGDYASTHFWYVLPVLDKGFIPNFNDSLYFEGGSTLALYYENVESDPGRDFAIVPLAGVRWNVHLTRAWEAFVTGKFGVVCTDQDMFKGLTGDFSVGGLWIFSPSMALRAEIGHWGTLRTGISYRF